MVELITKKSNYLNIKHLLENTKFNTKSLNDSFENIEQNI